VLTYLHGDPLGSASLATNASGTKITDSDTRYYPYGVTRPGLAGTGLPTDRRFTGQREESELGLYDYNARFYDPLLGRFISADTIVLSPQNPQSLNRYSYALNSPLRYTDPSGHKACLDTDCTQSENTVAFMKEPQRGPSPYFARLPLNPTNKATSQWFGATNFAYTDGDKWNYDNYCQGFHCGIDIGRETSEYGEPVYAGIYGIVESTENAYGAGPYAVNIRVGDYVVIYGHLDGKYNVKKGDPVTPYTIIAVVGNPKGIENGNNVHLHLEIRYQNKLIYNPLLFMDESIHQVLAAVIDPNDFHYTDKWATPLEQPVIHRGGPSLWQQ